MENIPKESIEIRIEFLYGVLIDFNQLSQLQYSYSCSRSFKFGKLRSFLFHWFKFILPTIGNCNWFYGIGSGEIKIYLTPPLPSFIPFLPKPFHWTPEHQPFKIIILMSASIDNHQEHSNCLKSNEINQCFRHQGFKNCAKSVHLSMERLVVLLPYRNC